MQIITTYRHLLTTLDGGTYAARSCGQQRADGLWEGWLEFLPSDGGPIIRSARETTQPNLPDLEYWASGLTRVYLEGALERALTPPNVAPAPRTVTTTAHGTADVAILDPFAVYAEGETLLRRRLVALGPRHLRTIARAYGLATDVELEHLAEPELITLIVAAVRDRAA